MYKNVNHCKCTKLQNVSAANGGEKNNFKIDEDEGDEVRYWYENRRYDSFSIHFLFRS